jgi:uncharacterized protein
MNFDRNIRVKIQEALDISPVVLLIGAWQTGKSTLIQLVAGKEHYMYVTLDKLTEFSTAKSDPTGYIADLKKPVILDEVQRIPEIFLPIKEDVDNNRNPGRYALTGSANPLLIPKLGDTLAGRMFIFRLYPLSQGELRGFKDDFIDLAFGDKRPVVSTLTKEELIEIIFKGGYPEVQALNPEQRTSWFEHYITTILNCEVRDISQIEGIKEFPLLLRLLAARSGSLLNASELARKLEMVTMTVRRYLGLLQAVFMLTYLRPWSVNIGNRQVRASKIYLPDTGLLTFLLGIDQERFVLDSTVVGGLLENFVVMELKKQATWSSKRVNLYFYRTVDQKEVDIILESPSGYIVAIEVKSSETISPVDFKNLKYLKSLYKEKFVRGIVLYTGPGVVFFGDKLSAWPIQSLWAKDSE